MNKRLTLVSKDMDVDEVATDDVNLANAVNLSGSEDEVEEEQIAGDFFNQDFVRIRPCVPSDRSLSLAIVRIPTFVRIESTSSNSR